MNQRLMVTTREITAAYATLENHITRNGNSRFIIDEDNMPRRMAWTMQHG
ncbi:hypothetical protein SRABI106_04297 [Rahnella aquatilis]|nr:hypothetical protein SRABI106_04297 [Rahnella aquatilis]